MNEEKVLAYLNLSHNQNNDKFLVRLCVGFNIGFSVMFGAVLLLIALSTSHIIAVSLFLLIDVCFFIVILLYKNPVRQFLISFVMLLTITAKLLYSYVVISNYEYAVKSLPNFTWLHLAVLLIVLCVGVYMLIKFYKAYLVLKIHTIKEAGNIIKRQNPVPKWTYFIAAGGSGTLLLIKILRDGFDTFGIGLGFCSWTLALLFLLIAIMILPKCIVSVKFKANRFCCSSKK